MKNEEIKDLEVSEVVFDEKNDRRLMLDVRSIRPGDMERTMSSGYDEMVRDDEKQKVYGLLNVTKYLKEHINPEQILKKFFIKGR